MTSILERHPIPYLCRYYAGKGFPYAVGKPVTPYQDELARHSSGSLLLRPRKHDPICFFTNKQNGPALTPPGDITL
jgi:hypothetical protein